VLLPTDNVSSSRLQYRQYYTYFNNYSERQMFFCNHCHVPYLAVNVSIYYYMQNNNRISTLRSESFQKGAYPFATVVCNRQVGVRTLNVSITKFNYLFWHTNGGRFLQRLALEIWGEKIVLEEGWRHVTSERKELSRVCEIPC